MFQDINKIILVGHVGVMPVMSSTPNGIAVARFSLATNTSWMDKKSNQFRNHTEWHNIVVRGAAAENVRKFLNKGDLVYIEGSQRTRSWQDQQTGHTHWITENICTNSSNIRLLTTNKQNKGVIPEPPKQTAPISHGHMDDDIPFMHLPSVYCI